MQGFNSKKFQHFDHGDPESNFEVIFQYTCTVDITGIVLGLRDNGAA